MRLTDGIFSTGWGIHHTPQLRASWLPALHPSSASPWPGLQHSHPKARWWALLCPGPGGQEPQGGGCYRREEEKGQGGHSRQHPSQERFSREHPHFVFFWSVWNDSGQCPELLPDAHPALGEALVLCGLVCTSPGGGICTGNEPS